jgi:tRNA(fMet)-specific endonuclease VapC
MENKIVLVDTSILIDLFRKTDKSNSALIALVRNGYTYSISAVTEYEIYCGASLIQTNFWDDFLRKTDVLLFDKKVARIAVEINIDLKRKSKQISIPDLFIAATAIANNLLFATLNKKHFSRVEGLTMI